MGNCQLPKGVMKNSGLFCLLTLLSLPGSICPHSWKTAATAQTGVPINRYLSCTTDRRKGKGEEHDGK